MSGLSSASPAVAPGILSVFSATLPQVVHLKRFSYSRASRDKLDAPVDFPLQGLDLAPYMLREQARWMPYTWPPLCSGDLAIPCMGLLSTMVSRGCMDRSWMFPCFNTPVAQLASFSRRLPCYIVLSRV